MSDSGNTELNEALRILRDYYGFSRNEIMEGVQISKSYLSELESGSKRVTLDVVSKYAEFLDLKPSMILLLGETLAEGRSAKAVESFVAKNTRKLMSWISEEDKHERGNDAKI